MKNDITTKLEILALEIVSEEENLHTQSENWIEEHNGFYYYPLSTDIYESLSTALGLDPNLLQVEILRFEPGANLKPHHHTKSDGIVTQVYLNQFAKSSATLSRWYASGNGTLQKDSLVPNTFLHVPHGYIHGFENNSNESITVLSIQSFSTEGDTNWANSLK